MNRFAFGSLGLAGFIALLVGAQAASERAAPPEELRFALPQGIRVLVMHVPHARRQTTYTLHPLTLADDDANKAQWSHLVEHMLIRTTDAEGLSVEGITFNGETTHTYLRLETFAEPAQWKAAVARHVRWLTSRDFDPQRLEREKTMIASEEQGTATGCFTGKFALAAWSQVVTHGQRHAAVHDDVRNAKEGDVERYALQRVRLDDSILIATIGPVAPAEMRDEIERLWSESKAPATIEREAAHATQPAAMDAPIIATWDLPTRHALWWWPLPDRRPQTLAAATAVGRALQMRFMGKKERGELVRRAAVQPFVTTPRGTFMVFDACIDADVDPARISAGLQECADALRDARDVGARQSIVFAGRMAAQECAPQPDFAMLAKQLPAHMRDAAEGLWLLRILNTEYPWGVAADEAQGWLTNLDDRALAEVLSRLASPAGSLTLNPLPQPAP